MRVVYQETWALKAFRRREPKDETTSRARHLAAGAPPGHSQGLPGACQRLASGLPGALRGARSEFARSLSGSARQARSTTPRDASPQIGDDLHEGVEALSWLASDVHSWATLRTPCWRCWTRGLALALLRGAPTCDFSGQVLVFLAHNVFLLGVVLSWAVNAAAPPLIVVGAGLYTTLLEQNSWSSTMAHALSAPAAYGQTPLMIRVGLRVWRFRSLEEEKQLSFEEGSPGGFVKTCESVSGRDCRFLHACSASCTSGRSVEMRNAST